MHSKMRWMLALVGLAALPALLALAGPGCGVAPALSTVGGGSAGFFGAPRLAGLGLPELSTPGSFALQITGGVPHAPGVLILARREQPLFSAAFQTTIYSGSSGVSLPFVLDSSGAVVLAPGPTSHPLSALCGLDLIAQAVVFDFTALGGGAWTNGLRFRFGTTP